MRLIKARIQNYRSIIDTGEFEVEQLKSIMVGPNEAGKTVILKALQQLKKPVDVPSFEVLRDYPRSKLDDITTGKVKPSSVKVVTGWFVLDEEDKKHVPMEFSNCVYRLYKNIDNKGYHTLENAPAKATYKVIKSDMNRMSIHFDKLYAENPEENNIKPSQALKDLLAEWQKDGWSEDEVITEEEGPALKKWLEDNFQYVEEGNSKEEERHERLLDQVEFYKKYDEVLKTLDKRTPLFILFNNYFRVKPSIHLEHLAIRTEKKLLDDEYYDYGNLCLLKLLGFTPKELSDLGKTESPDINDAEALKKYKDALDTRSYRLNAASVRLTNEIRNVWNPNPDRQEAERLRVVADGQYLKVVVEDELGVDIELDQRSEGFQWLVSFFVVFFAEAMDKHKNAILLLDEPGMSLHGLKQRDFRTTISRLAKDNQVVYTTHSPFLVGPDELDLVRVVEMRNRRDGSKVHTTLTSSDPAGLLPLQEALGYDLAQTLFTQQRNLILEGLTDYWYLEATAEMLRADSVADLNEKIALISSNTAGKVVYYATILHAQKFKVAALLDSDAAGDAAAQQENLVHALGTKNIFRTKDYCSGINKAEIEDLLRETLVVIVKDEYGKDLVSIVSTQSGRPIVDIFEKEVPNFSKYKLAKAYIRWTRSHSASDLTNQEREHWKKLIENINKALK